MRVNDLLTGAKSSLVMFSVLYLVLFIILTGVIIFFGFKSRLDKQILDSARTWLVLGFSLMLSIIAVWVTLRKKFETIFPFPFIFSLSLSIAILLSGTGLLLVATDTSTTFDFVLREENGGAIVGNISCTNVLGNYIGNNLVCDYTPKLTNLSAVIVFHQYGGQFVEELKDMIFQAPPGISGFNVYIHGVDNTGRWRSFTVANNWKFYTKEEHAQRNAMFWTYLAALVGITLVTVPAAVTNWLKLLGKKDMPQFLLLKSKQGK